MAAFFAVACQPKPTEPGPAFQDAAASGSSTLEPGDVVSISYPGASEFDQSQKIRRDGKISLPILGEVRAAGKTPKSFQEELTKRYEEDLQDPKVIVNLVSAAAVVYVNGAVLSPGTVLIDRQMTVCEAIMDSGGFSEVADRKRVILVRQKDGKRHRHVLNLKPDAEQEESIFYVQPYDTITVSQSIW